MATGTLYIRDPVSDPSFSYETSPDLYLFTSLTAGSSHILTATSRLETILKANRIPFKAVDIATDEKARRIWTRRAGKRKIPGLVKRGEVLADLAETEEWNEYGEIKENLGDGQSSLLGSASTAQPAAQTTPQVAAAQPATTSAAPVKSSSEAATTASPTTSPAQIDPLRSAQASLAAQAAALGAARSKPKPFTSKTPTAATGNISEAPSTETTTTTTPPPASTHSSVHFAESEAAHATNARAQSEHHASISHADAGSHHNTSAEADSTRDLDMSDPHLKHNTNQYAGLTPLHTRARSTSAPKRPDAEEEGHEDEVDEQHSNVPPPSAIDPSSHPTTTLSASSLAAVLEAPEASTTADEVKQEESSKIEEAHIPELPASDGAAPASKSGLEAVTSDPEGMAAAMAGDIKTEDAKSVDPSTAAPVPAPVQPPSDGAAPASKSGLEAVTSDPDGMAAAMSGEAESKDTKPVDPPSLSSLNLDDIKPESNPEGVGTSEDEPESHSLAARRRSNLSTASEEVVKAVEQRNSIPEAVEDEEEEGEEPVRASESIDSGVSKEKEEKLEAVNEDTEEHKSAEV